MLRAGCMATPAAPTVFAAPVFNRCILPAVAVSQKAYMRAPHVQYGERVSLEQAENLVLDLERMDNDVLIGASFEGNQEARAELLIRNIMATDRLTHESAETVLQQMTEFNGKMLWLYKLPYKVGLFSAVSLGLVSIPLVFHLGFAEWFNEEFVTFEKYGEGEADTWLEVGSWTWNWMEPPLGEVSFFLLTMQYARSQMMNLGWKPYGNFIQERKATRLIEEYPLYNARLVREWAANDALPGASS
jgi:hypothetical protein